VISLWKVESLRGVEPIYCGCTGSAARTTVSPSLQLSSRLQTCKGEHTFLQGMQNHVKPQNWTCWFQIETNKV